MEVVFMTIHDLSLDARIRFCSDSIEEVLGYRPHEVKGKSCWEYFHPDEIPFARAIHGRGLELEKAAALNYCRIRHKNGQWIGCECVFTVVYDVLVASTSIYKVGPKSEKRAVDGETIRRVFSSSPRDPRYHMLSYISNKFIQKVPLTREPRAALILNRFTRTSSIMFATNGVEQILGFSPAELVGKSFYYCIAENCLGDAVRTLESAKQNDSIAYLRFFFRDPTLPDPPALGPVLDEVGSDSDESEDGGVRLRGSRESSVSMASSASLNGESVPGRPIEPYTNGHSTFHADRSVDSQLSHEIDGEHSRASSGDSAENDSSEERIFDRPSRPAESSASSITALGTPPSPTRLIEVEAVVSCTSDGLVVILRRANPIVPMAATQNGTQPTFPNGLFATPWAEDPIVPDHLRQATSNPCISFPPMSEPLESGFMSAIRDVAVFAWSLTGINGSLFDSKHGEPSGEALPPGGLPVWDPNAPPGENDIHNGYAGGNRRPVKGMADASTINGTDGEQSSSDDEVVWKRVPVMPAFEKPKRRSRRDAFGTDDEDSTDHNGGVEVQDKRRRKLENGQRHNSSNSGS